MTDIKDIAARLEGNNNIKTNANEVEEKQIPQEINQVNNVENEIQHIDNNEDKENIFFKKISQSSKDYEKGTDYVKVKVSPKTLVKLKMLCSKYSITQQALAAYAVEGFIQKAQVKTALEKIKNELD